jgi:hypothetical protein
LVGFSGFSGDFFGGFLPIFYGLKGRLGRIFGTLP